MLVSSIARLNVHNTLNNSTFSQNNNSGISAHTFGGEHDLSMLNKQGNKLNLDLGTNSFLYKINFLQEKLFANQSDKVNKNKSLNVLA